MVALRSVRLEALLGSRLEDVQYPQLVTLTENQIPESFDLDYKSKLYGSSDKDKRDAATDVAALANTAGGLLILGIAEDDQARAESAPGVSLSEAEERRIRQIVGSQVVPLPVLDFLHIEAVPESGHGLLLIAVPRSPLAPHAVIVNDGLRYPRRNGATTRYLSEPEVAAAYRDRFTTARTLRDRAGEVEAEALARLDQEQAWIVLSLVPDLSGEMVVDQAALHEMHKEFFGKQPMIMPTMLGWRRVNIGRRRFLIDGTSDNSILARWLSAELHDDGSGIFAAIIFDTPPVTSSQEYLDAPREFGVSDEMLINGLLSGLRVLGHHAYDRAAAGGNALVRAQLYPVNRDSRLTLGQSRRGFRDMLGTRTLTAAKPPAERTTPLECLASDGPDLVATAYLLASDLFQEFGWAEAAQLTRDGRIRLRYWNFQWQQAIQQWATEAGVEVSQETMPG